MEKVIDLQTATKDFYKWIGQFGYSESDFAEAQDTEDESGSTVKGKDGFLFAQCSSRDKIINAICKGNVEILEDGKLKQVFVKPLLKEDGTVHVGELIYKNDYTAGEQNNALRGIDLQKDAAKFPIAMAAMLTGKGRELLSKVHAPDYKVLQSVVTFFLL
jgi:hypothetical protein